MQIDTVKLSPEEFELAVKSWFDATGRKLTEYKSSHREKVQGSDGIYEIDIKVAFQEFGAEFVVLIECKHHNNPIKREVVQVLHDKMISTGAHKGVLVATADFQRGAIEYAAAHGIALIRIANGQSSYRTKSLLQNGEPPPWLKIPEYVGWLTTLADNDRIRNSIVSTDHTEYLNQHLFSSGD